VLTDPLADLLTGTWRGVGGDYTLRIGDPSTVVSGSTAGLPTLEATVNAFSRMWFGVLGASSLAITDDLDGPAELLAALDEALCLPVPRAGWDF